MSFILDALKKSESDRQQKSTPDISDVPAAVSPAGTPRTLWFLIGLLTLTVVVLLAVLLRPTPAVDPPSNAAESAPVEIPPTEPAATSVMAQSPAGRTEAPPDTTESTEALAETPPVTDQPQAVQTVAQNINRSPEPAATSTAATPPPEQTETYLTFNDLRATGSLSLPDLHIDLHVYSNNPAERFVFINMNQYRENTTLSEGPRLRQITTEGVVLEFLGTTFLLPRE